MPVSPLQRGPRPAEVCPPSDLSGPSCWPGKREAKGEAVRRLAGGRGMGGPAGETDRLPDAAVEGFAISLARPRWRWGQALAGMGVLAALAGIGVLAAEE